MAKDSKFSDTLNGLLSRIFRQGQSSLHNPKGAEALRKTTEELSEVIDKKIRMTSAEVAKQLQDKVLEGFKLIEKDILALEKQIKEVDDRCESHSVDR